MKVPKYIKDSIVRSAKHRAIADDENQKIRDWLDEQGFEDNDRVIECLIDCIEVANVPYELIKFLEEDGFKK